MPWLFLFWKQKEAGTLDLYFLHPSLLPAKIIAISSILGSQERLCQERHSGESSVLVCIVFRCRIWYVLSNAWTDLSIQLEMSYFIPHEFKLGSWLFCVFWLFSHYHKTYTIMGQCVIRSHPFSPTGLKCIYSAASAPGRKERWISVKSPDLEWATAASKVPPWRWNTIKHFCPTELQGEFLETLINPYPSSSFLPNMQVNTPISQESAFVPFCAI